MDPKSVVSKQRYLDYIERSFKWSFFCITHYTPDIRSMWGYLVFAFPFVRSYVRTFVCSFVCSFVRSFVHLSFRHRVKVFALKFIRPHISKTL